MSRSNHRIYKLNREIVKIQLEENDKVKLRNAERKSNKTHFYHLSLLIFFFIIVFLGFHLISFIIGFILMIVGSAIDDYYEKKIESEKESIPYKQIVGENEFAYEEYRYAAALSKTMSEDRRKYQEALDKQNKNRDKDDVIYYSKEDEINLMVEMIEDYFRAYKLPPLRVKSYEWDVFFDTMYDEFKVRGIREDYFHAVSEVIRYTLANALLSEVKNILMRDFIDNLRYLYKTKTNEGILPHDFREDDVFNIQEKMLERIGKKSRKMSKKKKVLNN